MRFKSALLALIATVSMIGFAQAQSDSKQSETGQKTACSEGVSDDL